MKTINATSKPNAKPPIQSKSKKTSHSGKLAKSECEFAKDKLKVWRDELLESDPHGAMLEAHELLNSGIEILLKLMECKQPVVGDFIVDGAETMLCNHASRMINKLCTLVSTGHRTPIRLAWEKAKDLTVTIHNLALTGLHEELRNIARDSIFMPSLQAKPKNFTFDFEEIAKTIQLSENCAINLKRNARIRLDAGPTIIIVRTIDQLTQLQRNARSEAESFYRQKAEAVKRGNECPAYLQPYQDRTLEDYLQWSYSEELAKDLLRCQNLPPFRKDTADEWWEKAINFHLKKPWVLKQIRKTSPSFYTQLEKAAMQSKGSTKNACILDELKKRCQQVLSSESLFTRDKKL